MTDFTLTDYSTLTRVLTGFEGGLITNTGFLRAFTGTAISATNSGSQTAKLTVLGTLMSTGNATGRALNFNGASFNLYVGTGAQVLTPGTGTTAIKFEADSLVDVFNHGTISATTIAIESRTSDTYSIFNLQNTGQITSGDIGINLHSHRGVANINNSGTIMGTNYGIFGQLGTTSLHNAYVQNSGTIQGKHGSYLGSDGLDKVVNSGQMLGNIRLRDGDDFYLGSTGTITGGVAGEAGNDKIVGGVGNNVFHGGDGNDILVGNGGDDNLNGGNDHDILRGGDGGDTLSGDQGNDLLRGQSGEDKLDGGTGNDDLRGGKGDDDLNGGSGADVLSGGADDDILAGKTGVDTLTGGRGDDVFVFSNASHSGTGSAADTITDFGLGLDVIDLSGLTGGTLDFIGTSGFSNTAGEVRYNVTAAGTAKIAIDLDGDGSADMQIKLLDTGSLNAGDFML